MKASKEHKTQQSRVLSNNFMSNHSKIIQDRHAKSSTCVGKQNIIQLYEYRVMSCNENLCKNDRIAIEYYIKDVGKLVDSAACKVLAHMGRSCASQSLYYYYDNDIKIPLAALTGTAIHQETYLLLEDILSLSSRDALKIEKNHVDLQILLPSNNYVIFDITSVKQLGHTQNRGYEKNRDVVAVIEIAYDNPFES